jgi:hypothetical protein
MNDVGTDSEVRSAVQRAVTQTLLNSPAEEVFLNFMMKRFGDWCQALCLKDTTRRYKVVKVNRSSVPDPLFNPLYAEGDVVSLDDLQTIHKALIFLLTIDRVLLAFALALGINVIFTSKSGVIGTSWMTLFETGVARKDVSDAPDLYAKLGNLDQMIRVQRDFVQSVINSVEQLQVPIVNMQFDKYAVSLLALRNTLSILSFLPTIPTLKKHLIKVTEDHEEDEQFSFLVELGKFTVDAAGTPFGSIPSDINAVPKADRNRYQKTVNEFRSFAETVKKNQALIARYAAEQPPRSAEQVKEDGKVDMFFKTLAANPSVISSRHPLFKSVEQTLQSIISNAKLTGIKLTPLGDVSAAWDAAALREGRASQFVPRQSGRAAAAAPLPLKELFGAYQIASQSAAAARGGQRGGAMTLGDVFDAPFTEMVYVSGLPPGTVQLDDSRLETLKQAAIQEAGTRLTGQLAQSGVLPPGGMTPELFSANGGQALAAEIYSQLVGSGEYGGYISDGRGHFASVIDPYVFHEDDDLVAYLKDLSLKPFPDTGYVALRYMLWKTDELRMAINKLKGADPDNLVELDVYESIDTDVYNLKLLSSNQDLGKLVNDVLRFANGERNDKHATPDAGQGPGITTLEDQLDALNPFTRPDVILRYITAEVPEAEAVATEAIGMAKAAVIVANNIRTALVPGPGQDAATAAAQTSVAQAQAGLGVDLHGQGAAALIEYFEGLYTQTIGGILTRIQLPRPDGLGLYTVQEGIISFFKKEIFLERVGQLEEELDEVE